MSPLCQRQKSSQYATQQSTKNERPISEAQQCKKHHRAGKGEASDYVDNRQQSEAEFLLKKGVGNGLNGRNHEADAHHDDHERQARRSEEATQRNRNRAGDLESDETEAD